MTDRWVIWRKLRHPSNSDFEYLAQSYLSGGVGWVAHLDDPQLASYSTYDEAKWYANELWHSNHHSYGIDLHPQNRYED